MGKAVTLDQQHHQLAENKARSRSQTLEQYLQELIDADARTFDEILGTVRQGFESMTDEEVDELWQRARQPGPAHATG